MRTHWIVTASLVLLGSACGGEPRAEPPTVSSSSPTPSPVATSRFPALERADLLAMSDPVRLRGDGGVRLEGRLFGSGDVGVALAHMGGGDQSQWFGFAGLLADNGYRVLTYNRRGSCPGGELGCSGGHDVGGWRDLAFVVERLRDAGAQRVVVGGASLGAMESLYALSRGLDAEGLIWVAGVDLYGGVTVSEQTDDLRIPKLFMAGEVDGEAGDLLQVFDETAPEPTDVVTLDTGEHGTDILAYADAVVADTLRQAVLDFLARI
jgi:pimeloyl-ACP methyl ester carboxylesterase